MTSLADFYLLIGILVMALVTFLTRITPVILPKKWLDLPMLLAINKGLPLAVMTLLILASLSWYDNNQNFVISPLLMAQCISLAMVLLSYHLWKQLLVSMIIGIATLNLSLWLVTAFTSIN